MSKKPNKHPEEVHGITKQEAPYFATKEGRNDAYITMTILVISIAFTVMLARIFIDGGYLVQTGTGVIYGIILAVITWGIIVAPGHYKIWCARHEDPMTDIRNPEEMVYAAIYTLKNRKNR